jgi:hypothetical protein
MIDFLIYENITVYDEHDLLHSFANQQLCLLSKNRGIADEPILRSTPSHT